MDTTGAVTVIVDSVGHKHFTVERERNLGFASLSHSIRSGWRHVFRRFVKFGLRFFAQY
jgi:hypothetical protein